MRGKTLDYLVFAFVGISLLLLFVNKYGMNIIGKPTCECLSFLVSPKGYYRVQTCRSTCFGQGWLRGIESWQGYYKVFNNRTGELIAESDFGYLGGPFFWPTKEVHALQIGFEFSVPVPPEPE